MPVESAKITPPVIAAAGIVNAANYAGGAVAPGEIITLFGANYGPAEITTLQYDAAGRITTSLANTQLLFDGIAAHVEMAIPFCPTLRHVLSDVGTGLPVKLHSRATKPNCAPRVRN